MPRASRTGIRGYFVDADGRRRIDLRYVDAQGRAQRHKEVLPPGMPARAAELRAREVLAAAITGTLVQRGQRTAPLTLATAFAEYRRLCGTGNAKQKERHCRELLARIGDVPLGDVTELAIERFKRDRSEGKAPATVNRELQTLRHFFTCAVEWRWLAERPKVRLLREAPGRVRWLSDAEREKLYASLPARFKRVVLAAALSGQRLSNVIGLTRDRVDFTTRTLTIPKTKSGKRHDVPISDALAAVLREAIADGDAQATRRDVAAPAHVFVSRFGQPYTSSGVSGLFRKCAAEAGVKDFRFHDLRHDFASRIRRAGHGLDTVQALLGHASPVMTQRYAHIGRDELHAAVEAATSRRVGSVAPALPPGAAKAPKKRGK